MIFIWDFGWSSLWTFKWRNTWRFSNLYDIYRDDNPLSVILQNTNQVVTYHYFKLLDNFITFASIVILYSTDYKLALLEITKYLHWRLCKWAIYNLQEYNVQSQLWRSAHKWHSIISCCFNRRWNHDLPPKLPHLLILGLDFFAVFLSK